MTAALHVIEGGAAAALPLAMVRDRMAECRAILGGARDPMRAVWDGRATVKDRRLLLAMAGAGAFESARLSGSAWCDLPANVRGDVVRGLAKFRSWSDKVAP